MVVTRFVDREKELKLLRTAWQSRPLLIVVYGRRRIGKTRLILEWCKRSRINYVYYHAIPAKHDVNLMGLARAIETSLKLRNFSKIKYGALDSLLEVLSYRIDDVVIIIDEFTYWARAEPRVVGELQRFVDNILRETKMMIIIIGSLVGVMYRSVIGGGAPLYGRARYRIKLEELEPWFMSSFYPWLSREDWIRLYALLGGVPYYHSLVNGQWDISTIILKLLLEPNAPLRDEVLFILREEFRDPASYYSILKAIADGANTPSKVADYTGIHRQHVSKYLSVLEQLGFVKKEKPLFSKKGVYKVSDKLMNTWFKLVEPIVSSIGFTDTTILLEKVMSRIDQHVAGVFEDEIARKYVSWLAANGRIRYDELGRFIHRGVEVDLVAVDHRNKILHLFEVKWTDISRSEAKNIVRRLSSASRYIPLEYNMVYHLIARNYHGEALDNIVVHTIHDMPFREHR